MIIYTHTHTHTYFLDPRSVQQWLNMKQVSVILVAVTQLHHKIQIKYPDVSQDTITMTNNRNNMCMLLTIKYIIIIYNNYIQSYVCKKRELQVVQYNI
jgi:hypothetical protein